MSYRESCYRWGKEENRERVSVLRRLLLLRLRALSLLYFLRCLRSWSVSLFELRSRCYRFGREGRF